MGSLKEESQDFDKIIRSSSESSSLAMPSRYPSGTNHHILQNNNDTSSFGTALVGNSSEDELQDFDKMDRSSSESSTIAMPSRYPSSTNHHILQNNNDTSSFGTALVEELRDFDETFLFR